MDFGMLGVIAALGLSAAGSAIGIGIAGMATIGAWKKCYQRNKPAPFLMLVFAGAPLTQTIYGFITMNAILGSDKDPFLRLAAGLFGGLAIGASAMFQGKAAASASDAFADTGSGFVNYITIIGLVETVALFSMLFIMINM